MPPKGVLRDTSSRSQSAYKDYEQARCFLSYHFRFGESRAELETAMIRGRDRARTLSTPFRLHFYYDPTGILYEGLFKFPEECELQN